MTGFVPNSPALDIGGEIVPICLRINPRARRLIVRVPRRGEGIVVVAPNRRAITDALAFAERQKPWISQQLESQRARINFLPGASIPILGEIHRIEHCPGMRGGVWLESGGRLCVSGSIEHISRRVSDYLKRRARSELTTLTRLHSAGMKAELPRMTLRDPATRWGSCSHASGISYSWRLVFAPMWVMDYVVVHECAHLIHMNHSRAFWRLVSSRTPDMRAAIRWLAREGRDLHRYGA